MAEPFPLPPAPRLEPELEAAASAPIGIVPYVDVGPPPAAYVNPNAVIPPPPTPAERVQASVVDAVADTLHKIDIRAHLEMVARTDPRTFRAWVEMALPKSGGRGNQQATIVNVVGALPQSPLDQLPPGFDIHR